MSENQQKKNQPALNAFVILKRHENFSNEYQAYFEWQEEEEEGIFENKTDKNWMKEYYKHTQYDKTPANSVYYTPNECEYWRLWAIYKRQICTEFTSFFSVLNYISLCQTSKWHDRQKPEHNWAQPKQKTNTYGKKTNENQCNNMNNEQRTCMWNVKCQMQKKMGIQNGNMGKKITKNGPWTTNSTTSRNKNRKGRIDSDRNQERRKKNNKRNAFQMKDEKTQTYCDGNAHFSWCFRCCKWKSLSPFKSFS